MSQVIEERIAMAGLKGPHSSDDIHLEIQVPPPGSLMKLSSCQLRNNWSKRNGIPQICFIRELKFMVTFIKFLNI